jgi:uncharacterized membrane protein
MNIVDLLLRLFHILPAIFLAGGVFFMWCALLPALTGVSEDTRKTVLDAVRGKWSKVVMATSGLLLVTGLINAVINIKAYEYTGGPYHVYVLLKLLLALGIMFITAKLSGRSEGAAKFREKLPFWMTVTTGLLFALILIASTMKVTTKVPKVEQAEVPAQVIEESGN